ncbi:MAG: hypothetical protein HC804_00120 [Anaerolineae bacterium]|nr:hypothetical protein [Anaerolineae bacterium]
MKRTAKYVGNRGEFLNGIPARDLSETDIDLLSSEQWAQVSASPLYVIDEAVPKKGAAKKEGE